MTGYFFFLFLFLPFLPLLFLRILMLQVLFQLTFAIMPLFVKWGILHRIASESHLPLAPFPRGRTRNS